MSKLHLYFENESEIDLSWLESDEDPDDYLVLVAWVTKECECCGQERTVASLGNISFIAEGSYAQTGHWTEDMVSSSFIQDSYQLEVALDLLSEAQDAQ